MLYWPGWFNSLRWLVSRWSCVVLYIDKERTTLPRFKYEISFACFSPFSSSCCLCPHNGRMFVSYNNWTHDLTELICFLNHAVISLSVYSLVYIPVLLSSLMVASHCRHFIKFSSFFCGMSHVYEQLRKTLPLESGESQCKKAQYFSVDAFLCWCCDWTNLRYSRNST